MPDDGTVRKVGVLLCEGGRLLREGGLENPRFEARLLLAHVLATTQEDLLRDPQKPILPAEAARFDAAIKARLRRRPVAHILGRQGFWTLDLVVSPATLIPRPDSEAVVEAALDLFPDTLRRLRVLDLGTGTGCLLLAFLAERPNASGIGVDLSAEASGLAALNARRHGLAERASFVTASWGEALTGQFDLVVSNPPYVETGTLARLMPEVADYEPHRALEGGADGLDAYRRILAALPALIAPDGAAVLEVGLGQRADVERIGLAAGLVPIGCRRDLAGVERALMLRIGVNEDGEKSHWRPRR
jgi:release factor glutamine methyltransferase